MEKIQQKAQQCLSERIESTTESVEIHGEWQKLFIKLSSELRD